MNYYYYWKLLRIKAALFTQYVPIYQSIYLSICVFLEHSNGRVLNKEH